MEYYTDISRRGRAFWESERGRPELVGDHRTRCAERQDARERAEAGVPGRWEAERASWSQHAMVYRPGRVASAEPRLAVACNVGRARKRAMYSTDGASSHVRR